MTLDNTPGGLDRLLSDAFAAQARASVPDAATPPPPRFEQPGFEQPGFEQPGFEQPGFEQPGFERPGAAVTRTRRRRFAPLIAAAAVVVAASAGFAVANSGGDGGHEVASRPTTAATTVPLAERAAAGAQPVHVKLLNEDGNTYGVGMPVIAYFSREVTDARAFQKRTTVTVNGAPIEAAWYFEKSSADHGPLEAHLRPQVYWPAHASVHVSIAADGVRAGTGLGFDNDLSLDFRTGAYNLAFVDGATHTLRLTTDGKPAGSYPVSVGAGATPTAEGRKIIMDKRPSLCVAGRAKNDCTAAYAQRLTYDGEYLLSAPWNTADVARRVNATNGSTTLTPAQAKQLYAKLHIGDVVSFVNTGGPTMKMGSGYGDWNVSWPEWQTGGAVPTR